MIRYLVGFFITVGLIILLIVLIFSGGSNAPSKKVPSSGRTLESYAQTDAQVRFTIDGPINAVENHRQVQIIVDRNNAVFNLMKGYDGSVINNQSFGTTTTSYSAFLHGLEMLNFTKGDTSDKSLASENGHCPAGNRYGYDVLQNGRTIEHFWSTSCGGKGTYLGNAETTRFLFEQQIPHYRNLVSSVSDF
jgi:hypothetical protein